MACPDELYTVVCLPRWTTHDSYSIYAYLYIKALSDKLAISAQGHPRRMIRRLPHKFGHNLEHLQVITTDREDGSVPQ